MGVCSSICNTDTDTNTNTNTNTNITTIHQQPVIYVNDTIVLENDDNQKSTIIGSVYNKNIQNFCLDPLHKSPEIPQETVTNSLKTKENSFGNFVSSEDNSDNNFDDNYYEIPNFVQCD